MSDNDSDDDFLSADEGEQGINSLDLSETEPSELKETSKKNPTETGEVKVTDEKSSEVSKRETQVYSLVKVASTALINGDNPIFTSLVESKEKDQKRDRDNIEATVVEDITSDCPTENSAVTIDSGKEPVEKNQEGPKDTNGAEEISTESTQVSDKPNSAKESISSLTSVKDQSKPAERDKESAREAIFPKEEGNELIKARNLALKVMLKNKFVEEESESKALENGSNIDDMEHSNYSAECLEATQDSGWGWDSWADNFISSAASKVSNILETVEEQLGIPDPVEMAKKTNLKEGTSQGPRDDPKEINSQLRDTTAESRSEGSSWLSAFNPVSTLTSMVQNTGQDLVAGGIDALEYLGKKTVDIISEGDPGLRSKRGNMFSSNKTSLSTVLQEARQENENANNSIESSKKPEVKFSDVFEKFQGNANLEALEMLSNECNSKLERILKLHSDQAKEEIVPYLSKIRKYFSEEENETTEQRETDFKKEIFQATKLLKLKVTSSKLLNTWQKLNEKYSNMSSSDDTEEVFNLLILSYGEYASKCVELFRKIADMLLITEMGTTKEFAEIRAKNLKVLVHLFEKQLTYLTQRSVDILLERKGNTTSDIITDIYVESSNSVTVITEAHQLLLPILLCSVVK